MCTYLIGVSSRSRRGRQQDWVEGEAGLQRRLGQPGTPLWELLRKIACHSAPTWSRIARILYLCFDQLSLSAGHLWEECDLGHCVCTGGGRS